MPELSLEELLLREQSKANTDMIIGIIMAKPALFDELFQLVLRNSEPVSRRAAWVADYCTEMNPGLLNDRIEQLASQIPRFGSDGLKRHGLKMINRAALPSENLGILTDTCFKWLQSQTESIAVKMNCMEFLYRVTKLYPDIAGELYDIIEIQLNDASPGFVNGGKKLLKKLSSRH